MIPEPEAVGQFASLGHRRRGTIGTIDCDNLPIQMTIPIQCITFANNNVKTIASREYILPLCYTCIFN